MSRQSSDSDKIGATGAALHEESDSAGLVTAGPGRPGPCATNNVEAFVMNSSGCTGFRSNASSDGSLSKNILDDPPSDFQAVLATRLLDPLETLRSRPPGHSQRWCDPLRRLTVSSWTSRASGGSLMCPRTVSRVSSCCSSSCRTWSLAGALERLISCRPRRSTCRCLLAQRSSCGVLPRMVAPPCSVVRHWCGSSAS